MSKRTEQPEATVPSNAEQVVATAPAVEDHSHDAEVVGTQEDPRYGDPDAPVGGDGTVEVTPGPIPADAAAAHRADLVGADGYDEFPNQYAEERARAVLRARAVEAGARAGVEEAVREAAQRQGGISHLRALADIEDAKAFEEAKAAAKDAHLAELTKHDA